MDYKSLAKGFVDFYYKAYNGHLKQDEIQRHQLSILYTKETLLTNQDQELIGVESIMNYILNENLKYHMKEPVNISSQPSCGNSVLVCVQGESLFVDMEIPQRLSFSEIFLITINENRDGFVIMNQIFSTQGI